MCEANMSVPELLNVIKNLEKTNVEKDIKIFDLNERVNALIEENKSYDNLMGYTGDMTMEDKVRHNEECKKEIEEAEATLDEETKKEYYSDLEKEDMLVEYALQINQLQFETSELFHEMKDKVEEKDYQEYKKYKRNFYAMIETFYKIYGGEDKLYIFDILIEIMRKQRLVYKLDDCIKEMN